MRQCHLNNIHLYYYYYYYYYYYRSEKANRKPHPSFRMVPSSMILSRNTAQKIKKQKVKRQNVKGRKSNGRKIKRQRKQQAENQ